MLSIDEKTSRAFSPPLSSFTFSSFFSFLSRSCCLLLSVHPSSRLPSSQLTKLHSKPKLKLKVKLTSSAQSSRVHGPPHDLMRPLPHITSRSNWLPYLPSRTAHVPARQRGPETRNFLEKSRARQNAYFSLFAIGLSLTRNPPRERGKTASHSLIISRNHPHLHHSESVNTPKHAQCQLVKTPLPASAPKINRKTGKSWKISNHHR
ncbi:hypothetical protein B0T19DRAFT_278936 [Cercophora scortea]|uniref:Uncharacterized protein n=1 Tax=Cercophora scortea TaxID=314031 RepID=A0AAE0M6U0_9PEZI|nr:hypothetical protein B0T19DRAFT_278936 [Cercophora scortea]